MRFLQGAVNSVKNKAVETIVKGIVGSYAQQWTIEAVVDLVTSGKGVEVLFPEDLVATLRDRAAEFPDLRDGLTCKQFLVWVQAGNPKLFNEVVQNQVVMNWLAGGWETARQVLFEEEES